MDCQPPRCSVVILAMNEATVRRTKLISYLTDVLADPKCPIDSSDFGHFRLVGQWLGGGDEVLNQIMAAHESKPDVRDEVLVSVIIAALDRLLAKQVGRRK